MFKTRFISMLVLLAAVATGAVAQTTYKVSVKEGTEDATSWTIAPAEATTTGVAAGTTVTATYSGTKKVKSVKAVKKAPAVTTLNNTIKAWTAGSYAVPAGGLTYSDAITVSGDVTLTLTDGETLTLNKLTIQGNGAMAVNGTNNSTASTVAGSTGTLILTSGTLTATGGNGGSLGHGAIDSHGGNGGDAISGTLTINGGSTSVNDGSNGSIGIDITSNLTAGTGGKAVAGTVTDNRL